MSAVNYVDKLNKYYQQQGFPPYEWSIFNEAPLRKLPKPLSECTISLLSTGGISEKTKSPFDPNAKNNHRLDPIPSEVSTKTFQIHDNYYDHTDAAEDINCIFPLDRLKELQQEGVIGRVADRVWSGFMGRTYDRTRLTQTSAPAFFEELTKDEVDLLIAIPACPLDHQTAGLVCRVLEELGVSTVCVSTARDITAQVKPPRSIFVNFPLGNNFGNPNDTNTQKSILRDALLLGVEADMGGVLVDSKYRWPEKMGYDI